MNLKKNSLEIVESIWVCNNHSHFFLGLDHMFIMVHLYLRINHFTKSMFKEESFIQGDTEIW